MSYRKGPQTVNDLKCHVVWITKYRKPILGGEIAWRVRELVRQTGASLEVYIESGQVAPDHVHLLVSVPPQVSVSQLMQYSKGRSSRKLLDEFSELNRQFWGKHIWARGSFAASSGNVTDEIIKQYIEAQGQPFPLPGDGNFNIGEQGCSLGGFQPLAKATAFRRYVVYFG
jgi:putative transposase